MRKKSKFATSQIHVPQRKRISGAPSGFDDPYAGYISSKHSSDQPRRTPLKDCFRDREGEGGF